MPADKTKRAAKWVFKLLRMDVDDSELVEVGMAAGGRWDDASDIVRCSELDAAVLLVVVEDKSKPIGGIACRLGACKETGGARIVRE